MKLHLIADLHLLENVTQRQGYGSYGETTWYYDWSTSYWMKQKHSDCMEKSHIRKKEEKRKNVNTSGKYN